MIHHHQTEQVLDALSQHQLALFVGSRGTGKTCLIKESEAILNANSIAVVVLDAGSAQSADDLMAPIADQLRCRQHRLTAAALPDRVRLRVLIDNCDALHDKSWFPSVQDEWRGLLGEPRARGRLAFLLCGRPLFRRVAEGRGSPLLGIGVIIPSRPLSASEIKTVLNADSTVAEKVQIKTGGHPQLTRRLMDAINRDLTNLEARYADFARSQRRFLLQLIDDHGASARAVVAELLDSPRGVEVAEAAILARHFGGAGVLGQDTFGDLAASGLIERLRGSCRLNAEILRTDRELRQHLAAPAFAIADEPPVQQAEAADLVFRIENRLRQVVGSALAQVDETWWPSRFPPAVVREVEQRRRGEANSPAPPSTEVHPVAHLHLGELVDSILAEENWQQVFKVIFGMSREAFSQAAAALTAVRNRVAHNRPVGQHDLEVLHITSERFGLWPAARSPRAPWS
jgi:hypothetical protein